MVSKTHQLTDAELDARLHPMFRGVGVRVPSDPSVPIAPDVLNDIFPAEAQAAFLRDTYRLVEAHAQELPVQS